VPLPIHPEPLAHVPPPGPPAPGDPGTGSGGGSHRSALPDEAPATVARVVRLVGGFYDGKIFQRVEPNFVIRAAV
jgi:hypothetical protein